MLQTNEISEDDTSFDTVENETNVQALLDAYENVQSVNKDAEYEDDEEYITDWQNIPCYNILHTSMTYYSESIRLRALGIVVKSKRSTQRFTLFELELIKEFLTYNLGEKMEYLPLVKKALRRMSSSLIVLKRDLAREERVRNYERSVIASEELVRKSMALSEMVSIRIVKLIEAYSSFLIYLRDLCVNNLYPGATYNRRRSCLQILDLECEIFSAESKNFPWNRKQVECLFDCLLMDTYESNKQIAYTILKSLEPHLLRLDDEGRVTEIINVAIGMANSIRPIDSITAAYMFKLIALSPIVRRVLSTYVDFERYSSEVTDDVTLQLVILLVEQLKKPMELARENIVATVSKHSLYGYLVCLRSLLDDCSLGELATKESWRRIVKELVAMCFGLNEIVSQIVNNSSPEGHLPMDLNPQNLHGSLLECEATTVTPQMVLLCSWRTVKEVSLLFGHLTAESSISDDNVAVGLLTERQVIEIGNHLVSLLCETKHRGAFEQAYVGFAQLCARLWCHKGENLSRLPKIWLHQLLLAVAGFTDGDSKLCATRRSAGVPFMVLASVSTEPCAVNNTETTVFRSVMKILLGFTNLEEDIDLSKKIKCLLYEESAFSELENTLDITISCIDVIDLRQNGKNYGITEVKTHALNILRALFKHSRLRDSVRTYVADGLIAAIKSYDGKTWAERNAATLLFSALIVRIFGVQRTKDYVNLTKHNKMTGRIFFEKYPSLLPFMIGELQDFINAGDTVIRPSIQSILLLLSRLYPSNVFEGADCTWKIHEFVSMVSKCARSRIYKTRELAARALVPLLTEKSAPFTVVQLYQTIASSIPNQLSFNAVHGYMLQVLEIAKTTEFKEFLLARSELCDLIDSSNWILSSLESTNDAVACFPLATAYVNFFIELFDADCTWLNNAIQNKVFVRLEQHLIQSNVLKQRPGRELYEIAVARFVVSVITSLIDTKKSVTREKQDIVTWQLILSHCNTQVQIIGWSKATYLIRKDFDVSPKKAILDQAVNIALNKILEPIEDPEQQDVIYEFLYTVLTNLNKDNRYKFETRYYNCLYYFIVTTLSSHTRRNDFNERANFLKLLGKTYGMLSQSYKDKEPMSEYKRDIYRTFLNNSWMCSSDNDHRIAVSEVMYDLFIDSTMKNEESRLLLDWWTTLLNLLVDDNAKIRQKASLVICKIEPRNDLECDAKMMELFFKKFLNAVSEKYSEVAFAALFSWGVALLNDSDYEMDETDVFNKCRNYACFEPLQISTMCVENLRSIVQKHSIDQTLSLDLKCWLGAQLNFSSLEFESFRELVIKYREHVPVLRKKLDNILDPTYSDKLQQVLAYEKFESLVSV